MFPTGPNAGMPSRMTLAAFILILSLTPAWPQAGAGSVKAAVAAITPAQIESASFTGGDLPSGQSALTAKVQVLLDRSGISPGVVDGWRGGMSDSAIKAFQRRAGLPITGKLDHSVWDLLQGYAATPLVSDYTITEDDAVGLVDNIPADYGEKAKMSSQGYTSILEKLAERFHMDEKFLMRLNPGVDFIPGATIHVTLPAKPVRTTVTRIIVDKATRRVAAYDAKGTLVADYPATVGSTETPSPHGNHTVDAVALNPTYTYNPKRNFQQGENDRVLIVPPGPNGPVGNVWIDLSQPTYGIHGTPTPSKLFVSQSHGCVRLTNWDAWELAHMVKAKVTTVEFLDPGVSIADVTGGAPVAKVAQAVTAPLAAIDATRPIARGGRIPSKMTAATSPVQPAQQPDALAESLINATAGATSTVVVTPAPTVITPDTPTSHEPLVSGQNPAGPYPDEPEYPSDNGAGDQAVGVTTLPPQTGQP